MTTGPSERQPPGVASAGVADEPAPAAEPLPDTPSRELPVLVTGAAGFVGSHVCRELVTRGWKVRAFVHHPERARRRLAELDVQLVPGDVRDPAAVEAAARGTGAVIHLAAIAVERRQQRYEEVNAGGTMVVLGAAHAAGVDRLVHMSQNGASSASSSRFLRSKGVAEDAVRASGLRWTVFRPSVIFGPGDEFATVLARLVRLSPFLLPLPGGGAARFQPVAVADVARAACLALERPTTEGGVYGLGGPATLTLRQMAERILTAMDVRRAIVGVPLWLMRPLVALLQRAVPNPPVTTSLLELLDLDNTVPENGLTDTFGVLPSPFAPEEIRYLRDTSARAAWNSLFTR